MHDTTLAAASLLSVKALRFAECESRKEVVVDVELYWWALLSLGLLHRAARREVDAVLAETTPPGIMSSVGKVSAVHYFGPRRP